MISLLFNTLSRFVTALLPRSRCLLISVTIGGDFEPKKIKSTSVSIVSSYISHEVMGPDAMILVWDLANASADFRRGSENPRWR